MIQSLAIWKRDGKYNDEELDFGRRIRERSGLVDKETYLPKSINPLHCGSNPDTGIDSALQECRQVVFGAVSSLLAKTNVDPQEIDIVITTCSIFCPTPSMSSMIINKFKMRKEIQGYHLAGMGCSNGVIGVNLVRDLIQSYPKAKVLFITTETTGPAYYPGYERSRMVTNVIFRMGSAAMLFTGDLGSFPDAKYRLMLNERINLAASDSAYHSIFYGPDSEGINGVSLSKDVVHEAGHVLTKLMWKVGGRVLPFKEQARVAWSLAAKRFPFLKRLPHDPDYKPSFHGSVEHFTIHSGGKKILQGIGEGLKLRASDIEPSTATLYHYGNVSSSSTWYALAWIESLRGMKKGDRVMQVGIGSGCKAGINLFKAIRDIDEVHEVWRHLAGERVHGKRQQSVGSLGTGFVKVSFYVLLYLLILQLISILMALLAKYIK